MPTQVEFDRFILSLISSGYFMFKTQGEDFSDTPTQMLDIHMDDGGWLFRISTHTGHFQVTFSSFILFPLLVNKFGLVDESYLLILLRNIIINLFGLPINVVIK
jgi:hypothetical protein